MPAPLFTKENAGVMAKRATRSRMERIQREKEQLLLLRERNASTPLNASEDEKKARVQRQIEQCDTMLAECADPETFVRLVAAKARLWELLYPKPGSLRPKQSRSDRAPIAPIQPLPEPLVSSPTLETTDKPLPVVPSEKSDSHNIVNT